MRPGRPDDLAAVARLLEQEVRSGRREVVPGERRLRRMVAGFDWAASSRMSDARGGGLDGAVLVTSRDSPLGAVSRVEVAVSDESPPGLRVALAGWGAGLSRAAGAVAAQVWVPRGQGAGLEAIGLQAVRPWWRMDRSLTGRLPEPVPVPGYAMRGGPEVAAGVWSEAHNRSFADHWRYSPRTEEELMAERQPELALLAVDAGGSPAAITLNQVERYGADARPQPVGVVGSVGTMPGHRRRGLAAWLLAESLVRLASAGARHASLYVDGLNPTGAPALYRKLGFDVAFETEVWEATFP